MKFNVRLGAALLAETMVLASYAATAADKTFHDAPASVKSVKNPFAGQAAAIKVGGEIFSTRCSKCHGQQGQGTGNIPALTKSSTQSASDGELFWFITTGSVNDGMPAWEKLPEKQRWQIVAFIKAMHGSAGSAAISPAPPATVSKASSPSAPFTDYRYEKPGTVRKITVSDLPAPYATKSSGNGPRLVARPANAWPQAPAGFKVEQYAVGLDGPCLIRTAPNGDSFVAETARGDIKVLRGISSAGKAEQVEVFTQGLNQPYGIAFYPPGPDPQWVYVGNTDSVVRIPYQNEAGEWASLQVDFLIVSRRDDGSLAASIVDPQSALDTAFARSPTSMGANKLKRSARARNRPGRSIRRRSDSCAKSDMT